MAKKISGTDGVDEELAAAAAAAAGPSTAGPSSSKKKKPIPFKKEMDDVINETAWMSKTKK
jgi:hypothetical protein